MPEKSQDQGLGRTLFEVTIEDTSGSGNEGLLTVSEPAEKVYLLRFGHGADNRLTSGFCRAFILGLGKSFLCSSVVIVVA